MSSAADPQEPLLIVTFQGPDGLSAAAKTVGQDLVVGRGEVADVKVHDMDRKVSRTHLTVTWRDGQFWIVVQGRAGLLVNNRHLGAGAEFLLAHAAEVQLPGQILSVQRCDPEPAPESDEAAAARAAGWAAGERTPQVAEQDVSDFDALLREDFAADTDPGAVHLYAREAFSSAPPEEPSAQSFVDRAPVTQRAEIEYDDPTSVIDAPALQTDPENVEHVAPPTAVTQSPEIGAPAVPIPGLASTQQPGLSEGIELPPWKKGTALFRVPRTMWSETSELAELRLAPESILTTAMRASLEQTMVGRGTRTDEHGSVKVGQRMKAVLYGDARYFRIEPLGSEVQHLQGVGHLGWDWRVVPMREGHSLLTLRISMLADADGQEMAVDAQALHTSVEITVRSLWTRPARFVRDHWKWMLGSSGIGAAAAIVALARS
ncbi:MAG: FHA domain-containing protein [Pseudomonadota bacterium]